MLDIPDRNEERWLRVLELGQGHGNWGHEGIPGQRGGSKDRNMPYEQRRAMAGTSRGRKSAAKYAALTRPQLRNEMNRAGASYGFKPNAEGHWAKYRRVANPKDLTGPTILFTTVVTMSKKKGVVTVDVQYATEPQSKKVPGRMSYILGKDGNLDDIFMDADTMLYAWLDKFGTSEQRKKRTLKRRKLLGKLEAVRAKWAELKQTMRGQSV